MKYVSTRGTAPVLAFDDIPLDGFARDGGLYVPEAWPRFSEANIGAMASLPYPDLALRIMAPFVGGALAGLGFVRCRRVS